MQILIDAYNLAWRTGCAVGPHIDWGMEFGTLRSLISLRREYPSATFRFIWDSRCVWRRDIFPSYKGYDTRVPDPERDALNKRVDDFKHILAMVVPLYWSLGCEADDVIAALVQLLPQDEEIIIYSPDKDFHQLVTGRVSVLEAIGQKKVLWTREAVCKEWGVDNPRDLRWLRALTGCQSDKVPGSGIPKKLLPEILASYPKRYDTMEVFCIERNCILELGAKKLTPGWAKRLEAFKDNMIRNYRIMTLDPPRIGPSIICDYFPNFGAFYAWTQEKRMDSIAAGLINAFGESDLSHDPLCKGTIEHPWLTHEQRMAQENEYLQTLEMKT